MVWSLLSLHARIHTLSGSQKQDKKVMKTGGGFVGRGNQSETGEGRDWRSDQSTLYTCAKLSKHKSDFYNDVPGVVAHTSSWGSA